MSVRWFDVLNEIIKTAKVLQTQLNELDCDIEEKLSEYNKNTNEQNYKKLQRYINIRDDMITRLIGICSMLKEV